MGSTLAAMAMSAFAMGAPSSTAQASIPPQEVTDAVRSYTIPAGSMADALSAFADANGFHLLYDTRLTQAMKSRGLSGQYSPQQGLGLLLSGTGLAYRFVRKGRSVSIVLAQNDTGTQSDAGGIALPTVDVTATGDGGAGEGGPGGPHDPTAYAVPNSTTATKTDTPIMQTPLSVQVVPQQVLKDQQVVFLDQALQNVSNVYTIANAGQQACYMIRGFFTCNYYLDGVRVNDFWGAAPRDMADIQQVQVLKGPASILYGRLEPGGLIELDTKQPLNTPYYSIEQQIGSYGFYRTVMDMTGPVTPDNNLLYRFDAAYDNAQSFRELDHLNSIFLAPRLHWAPTQDTQFNFYLEYRHDRAALDFGTPVLSNYLAPVPISRNYGAPDSAFKTNYDARVGFNWLHAFNDSWTLVQRFDAEYRDLIGTGVVPLSPDCTITFCQIPRIVNQQPVTLQDYYTSLELTGHFDTLGAAHTLLVGGDYLLNHTSSTDIFVASTVPSTFLFNPVPTGNLAYLLANPDSTSAFISQEDWYGFYLQDQVTLPYNVHLLAGVRYDNAGTTSEGINTFPAPMTVTSSGFRSDAVKPRFGLLWQPIPQLSLYGNYVENFGIANSPNPNQAPLPPTLARQWEAGMKTDLLENRLSATVAWFDIVKTNVATPDPNPALAALGYAVATGAVRNTGIEFDIQGQLSPEVKIIGSYATIDSKIIKDNNGEVGERFYGVPRNGGSLWAVYSPLAEPVKGLALGAGFIARSNVEVSNPYSFTLPGYATVNLMARYAFTFQQTKLTFQLNVNNLLDKVYYQTGGGTIGILPGTPRTILGSIRAEF